MHAGRNGGRLKSGNRVNCVGRPKGHLPQLKELIIDVLGEEQNDIPAIKAILIAMRNLAIRGNIKAAELLLKVAYKDELNAPTINAPFEVIIPQPPSDSDASS